MFNFYDIAYGTGLALSAPYWLLRESTRDKVKRALKQRMGHDLPPMEAGVSGTIMIHAVSLGEVNATRSLVQSLREARPRVRFVISTTTQTGEARAKELYGQAADVTLIRYPLDFSAAVVRVLDAVKPDVVVLMELEVWPNFVKRCKQRDIPVMVANARLTARSFRNYRLGLTVLRETFERLTLVCAQEMTYAERFLDLGVPPHHVVVTGTMKFDNANLSPPSPLAAHQAAGVGLRGGEELIWVAGSTGPGEEEILLRVYEKLLSRFTRLRLVIVPRHPQRFDEVADLIAAHKFECVRFSRIAEFPAVIPGIAPPPVPPIVLIDAMGVLRDFYSIADVVFVGRSIVDLGARQHGSDMIEPAALGKAVVTGKFTSNFAEAMNRFREADAMMEVADEADLEQAMSVLLSTPQESLAMGRRAAMVVKQEQGATMRHVSVILQVLAAKRGEEPPPEATRPITPTTRPTSPTPSRGKIVIFGEEPGKP